MPNLQSFVVHKASSFKEISQYYRKVALVPGGFTTWLNYIKTQYDCSF